MAENNNKPKEAAPRETRQRIITADTRNEDAALGNRTVADNGTEYVFNGTSRKQHANAATFTWSDIDSAELNSRLNASRDASHAGRSVSAPKNKPSSEKPVQLKAAAAKKRPAPSQDKKPEAPRRAAPQKHQKAAPQKQQKPAKPKAAADKKQAPAISAVKDKSKKKKNKTPKSGASVRRVGFLRGALRILIIFVIIGGIAGGAYTAHTISEAPVIHPDRIYEMLDVSTHIYDDKGKLVDEIYYAENREITTYDDLPENLKNAFIAIEDKTFWTHKGFNFRRIFGAIAESFRGERISGTSTITQQLARNVFLPDEKSIRSIKRKIIEMYYAYEIEQVLSKKEILTAYLNTIYLGYGCYGVDTAAKVYFSKDVDELNLEESAALAALPQAPGSYALLVSEKGEDTPKVKKGVYANDASRDRRYLVLDLMADQGYITKKEAKKAKEPVEEFINPGSTGNKTQSAFKDYLILTVTKDLMKKYDISEETAANIVYTKGLKIYSTMDRQAQKVITKEFKKKEGFPSAVKKGSSVEAAMVVTEVGTGKIKAMAGTRSAKGQMLFNRATNPRQPGSSIKPLTVYSAALQKSYECRKNGRKFPFVNKGYDSQGASGWGDYLTVSSKVVDEKMTVDGQTWPNNVTRSYSGFNTFRSALQKSINTCAVKILVQVGVQYSMDMLKDFGITTAVDDSDEAVNDLNYAALGLGAMSEGVSPLQMSLAYAAFPNGGVRNTPICYTKVEDSEGNVILKGKSKEVRVMDEGVAWIMTNVLQSVVSGGIAYPASIYGIRVGGKTGTTDDRYDIWFDGFTPSYSASLWIGTDDNVPMDTGSEAASAMWSRIVGKMDRAREGYYRAMPWNITIRNGEYFTTGTEPPEIKEEKDEDKDKKDKKDNKDNKDKKSDNKSGKKDD